ncbi:hypothetical protein ACWEP1_31490, partial [Streptomyces sp. NPDC004285]
MVNDDGNGTVGAGVRLTGGPVAGESDMRTGVGAVVPEDRAPGAGAGGDVAGAGAVGGVSASAVGTAVLLAAAPAGRGRAMDAASVL